MVQVGEKRNLMKYFYPAIFTLDRKKNEFRAVFPDLTGCVVKAESMAEAARKAREALGMALMELEEKGIEFPAASDECALQRAYPYCQVGVVLLDMDVYRAYREYRMEQALDLLLNQDEKTYVIAEKVGYSDPNYFSYAFKKQFGMSPSKYKAEKRK